MRTLVIAEPGCTAQGDHATMLRLIDTAAECGADVFKTTWVSSAQRLADRRHAQDYLYAYRWHEWPVAWHFDFHARCVERGLKYACTVDLPEDVAVVEPFVEIFKVASFEALDPELARGHGVHQKLVFVSTGMMDDGTIMVGWDRVYDSGRMVQLHCTSSYPSPLSALNLLCIDPSGRHGPTGLSDHSRHLLTGAVAVGIGASYIETHYRLDDCDPANPDYAVAFTPAEFTQYIKNIRDAELMLGDGVKRVQPCEEPMLKYRVMA